jgi:hypothetical protein
VTAQSIYRGMLVAGLIVAATGAYGTREWDTSTSIAQFGVIVIIAIGVFLGIVGALGILLEKPPADPVAARRRRILDRTAWKACLPALIAVGGTVGFFAATNRWDDLGNPVAAQIAIAFAVVGVVVGMLTDRITRWDFVLIPTALLIALLLWGTDLPLESSYMSTSEMVALLVIVVLFGGIIMNLPQIIRGRNPQAEGE